MSFPENFYQHLANHTLTGIQGGSRYDRFLDIWMVQIEGRVFARSWNRSPRSWFTALLNEGKGAIRYQGQVLPIRGAQVTDPALNHRIDEAYRARYTQPGNEEYVAGITQAAYHEVTVELIPTEQS